jgi:ligand-binding SRPBCC domain-containing protein
VFPFFADARNLERITPDLLRFRVLTPAPIQMRPGALIDYRLSLRGLPMRWQTQITSWDPPMRFEDRQLKGPYRQWWHTHLFAEADGGTTVRDEVRYRLRGPDLLTRAINRLLVQPDVSRIFAYRHGALEQALGVEGRSRQGPVSIVRGHL